MRICDWLLVFVCFIGGEVDDDECRCELLVFRILEYF